MNKILKMILFAFIGGILLLAIHIFIKDSQYADIEYIVMYVLGAVYGILLSEI